MTGELVAADDIDGDDMQRDRQILEGVVFDVAGDQAAQAGRRDEVVARPEGAEQPCDRIQREGLSAPQISPGRGEGVRGRDGLGRDAMNAPFIAPADVPTMRSGSMARS